MVSSKETDAAVVIVLWRGNTDNPHSMVATDNGLLTTNQPHSHSAISRCSSAKSAFSDLYSRPYIG